MKKIVLSVLVAGSLLATSCKEVKKGATDLKDATVETAGSAVDATTDAAGAVVEGAKDAAGTAVDATTNAAGAVVDGVKDAASTAVDATTNAANAVVDGAKDAAGTAVDATKNAANAVVDGAKDAANAVGDKASNAVNSVLGGVTIPSFSNEAVTKNLTEYAAYAKDYIAAKGNVGKLSALAPKGAALLAKGKELASKLDASELAKYKSVLSAIQSKMAPSN